MDKCTHNNLKNKGNGDFSGATAKKLGIVPGGGEASEKDYLDGEFYFVHYRTDNNGKKIVDKIKVHFDKFFKLLYSLGFQLLEAKRPYTYIRIVDNVIEEVDVSVIQNELLNYVRESHKAPFGVKREQIIQMLHTGSGNYFSDTKLNFLYPRQIEFCSDTRNECYIYYRNGFVKCNTDGASFHEYKHLTGAIWKEQKNDRDFKHLSWELSDDPLEHNFGVWQQFLYNVCRERKKKSEYSPSEIEKNKDRLNSLYSILGYLMHHFFDYTLRAVIFTDSKVSTYAEGGTGKSLIGEGLGKVRKRTVINGKNFQTDNQFKYQTCRRDTQLIHINDTEDHLKVEGLFNDITDRIEVRKLHKEPFPINAKMLLSANRTLTIEGDSAQRRFIEYELSSYYGKDYTPEDNFGHRLFSGWDAEEWNRFDNLMAYCVCYFLKYGIIEPEPINLMKRKLVENTSIEFVEFMEDHLSENKLNYNQEFEINGLFKEFFEEHQNYEKHTRFRRMQDKKRCLEFFANANNSKLVCRRSNSVYFATLENQQHKLPF
jgi:hypothetical protein